MLLQVGSGSNSVHDRKKPRIMKRGQHAVPGVAVIIHPLPRRSYERNRMPGFSVFIGGHNHNERHFGAMYDRIDAIATKAGELLQEATTNG